MPEAKKVFVAFVLGLLMMLDSRQAFRTISGLGFLELNANDGQAIPHFQFDPTWPKQPLPNDWVVGRVVGVRVDSRDHIWIVHRLSTLEDFEKYAATNPPIAECCRAAPPVLEFDQQGTLLQAWGGPGAGYEWPDSEHGIFVDDQNNVWVGGNGPKDHQILKFTEKGKFLLQVGHKGQGKGSSDTRNFGRPASFDLDRTTNELYVADGYGNRRVIVIDAETGAYKRNWGAYGKPPDDSVPFKYIANGPPGQQFSTPHCVRLSKDGLVYVCDLYNRRIQVFRKDGTFVKEGWVAPNTLEIGSVHDINFSTDAEQRFLYVTDAGNQRIRILRRQDLQVIGTFGHGGHFAGGFTIPHSAAVDSKGNLYVGEGRDGKRVQRFLYKGTR